MFRRMDGVDWKGEAHEFKPIRSLRLLNELGMTGLTSLETDWLRKGLLGWEAGVP